MRPSPLVLAEWMTEALRPSTCSSTLAGSGPRALPWATTLIPAAMASSAHWIIVGPATALRTKASNLFWARASWHCAICACGSELASNRVTLTWPSASATSWAARMITSSTGLAWMATKCAISSVSPSAGAAAVSSVAGASVAGAPVVASVAAVPGVVSSPAASSSSPPHDAATSARTAKVPSIIRPNGPGRVRMAASLRGISDDPFSTTHHPLRCVGSMYEVPSAGCPAVYSLVTNRLSEM